MLFFNRTSALIAAAALVAVSATACGQAAKASTPTALTASPSDFDGQSVSVSGTAKSPATRKTRRGQMLTFQLCDTQCVSVVEFGADATVAEGSTQSVTGTFHQSFGRMRRLTNVIVVGGRPGGGGGHAGGGNAGGATNAGADGGNGATNASSDSTNGATNAAAPEASPT